MKKTEIRVGAVYAAKVGNNITGVRIMKESIHGGWDGINVNTNKPIRIKSPTRLRGMWDPKSPTKIREESGVKEENAAQNPPADIGNKRGGLNGAVRVLQEAGQPLNCKEMVRRMIENGYWATDGKTPAATIYSAIIREIKVKGEQSRFRKMARGSFELAQ